MQNRPLFCCIILSRQYFFTSLVVFFPFLCFAMHNIQKDYSIGISRRMTMRDMDCEAESAHCMEEVCSVVGRCECRPSAKFAMLIWARPCMG